tara:strand:+ start:292 stop:648 length:357 start_codon:yes stop_codon:yes gene_type:complete
MSLTKQTIVLATSEQSKSAFTMPAEHIYPFIVHRTIDETREKEQGKRHRYSRKLCITHLLTGALLGTFASYGDACQVVKLLKDEPIWLMPTTALLSQHPDWERVAEKVRDLKHRYGYW